jgi:CO dehydrogenase nickel-insertion accessory protein CooC1
MCTDRIASKLNNILDIINLSEKSFDHVERAYHIVQEVKINFNNFCVVGGFRFPENLQKHAKETLRFEFLGKIAHDENVEEHVLAGKSLLDLPSDSSAYAS